MCIVDLVGTYMARYRMITLSFDLKASAINKSPVIPTAGVPDHQVKTAERSALFFKQGQYYCVFMGET